MAIARPRTARTRRQTGWLRLAVFGVVAVVGGTAFWTSLQYSEAHAAARATADVRIGSFVLDTWCTGPCLLPLACPACALPGFRQPFKRLKCPLCAGALSQQDKQLPAHQAQEAAVQPAAGGNEGEAAADGGSQGGSKETSDPAANLAAWTEITTLPTGKGGSAVTGSGEYEGEQQQQEQREQQAGGQAKEQPAAAGGGPSPGDKFVTVELRVPKVGARGPGRCACCAFTTRKRTPESAGAVVLPVAGRTRAEPYLACAPLAYTRAPVCLCSADAPHLQQLGAGGGHAAVPPARAAAAAGAGVCGAGAGGGGGARLCAARGV